jgi:ribosomal protein S18 acetylase RimI-like enzyme
VGFVKTRKLPGFSGKTSILQCNNEIRIKEINTSDFQLPQSFCEWEPTWQHKLETTNKLDIFKIYGAYSNQNLVGFLCANIELGRVAQFAVHPDFRRQKVASSLFQHLSGIYTDELRVFNIDGAAKESQLFLKNIGLENTITQHEMVLKLS